MKKNKIMNLADGKVLYDDLRGRVEERYTKPDGGIPGSDIAEEVLLNKADVIKTSASGSLVTLTDAKANVPLTGCTVHFGPVQAGSGDPAPDNVRAISGWTGVNVYKAPTDDPDDPDKVTYLVSWQTEAGTVYGGYVDLISGVLTAEYGSLIFDGSEDEQWGKAISTSASAFAMYYVSQEAYADIRSDYLNTISSTATWGNYDNWISTSNNMKSIYTGIQSITTVEAWKEYLSEHNLTVCYKLETPVTYQLTPVEIRTLLGVNNIWSDANGNTVVEYYADTKAYVDQNEGVTDVKVNGTSVVNQGVVNIPLAANNTLGVIAMAPNSDGGLVVNQTTGRIYTVKAANSELKKGTDLYKVVVPANQDASAFYGIAKAAGDSTQSASSNAVGTYTETALSKISDMLNAPVSVSGSTPSITAMPGVRYICGEVSTLSITAPASGCIDVVFESGSTPTVLTVTSAKTGVTAIKWANGFDPTSLDADTTYEINILDGEYGVVGSWT